METKTWAKTLVGVYKYLQTISDTIDDMVKKDAHNAVYNYRPNSVYDVANRMMSLNNRKVTIINLKILVEDMVAKLGRLDMQIITLNMFEGIKSSDVCAMLGLSMRTFFRRKKLAFEALGKALLSMGYDNEKMLKLFGQESWLINAYNYNLQPEQDSIEEVNEIYTSILDDIKSTSCYSFA